MSLFRGYFVGVGVDPSGEDWVDPVITKVRPESNCCNNPMPLWDYWNYSSVDECTAHILLMAALHPGGSLFAVSATVRAAIVKATNTGNWAGLIAVIGTGYAAKLAAGITCAEMVCEWKDIKAPKCDIVEYQVFGLCWTWTCYRVACFCPLGSELWKYPPVGEYDHQPNWDFDQLKKDAQKDWPAGRR